MNVWDSVLRIGATFGTSFVAINSSIELALNSPAVFINTLCRRDVDFRVRVAS